MFTYTFLSRDSLVSHAAAAKQGEHLILINIII